MPSEFPIERGDPFLAWLYSVFQTEQFPAGVAHLDPGLSHVDGDDFSLKRIPVREDGANPRFLGRPSARETKEEWRAPGNGGSSAILKDNWRQGGQCHQQGACTRQLYSVDKIF